MTDDKVALIEALQKADEATGLPLANSISQEHRTR